MNLLTIALAARTAYVTTAQDPNPRVIKALCRLVATALAS